MSGTRKLGLFTAVLITLFCPISKGEDIDCNNGSGHFLSGLRDYVYDDALTYQLKSGLFQDYNNPCQLTKDIQSLKNSSPPDEWTIENHDAFISHIKTRRKRFYNLYPADNEAIHDIFRQFVLPYHLNLQSAANPDGFEVSNGFEESKRKELLRWCEKLRAHGIPCNAGVNTKGKALISWISVLPPLGNEPSQISLPGQTQWVSTYSLQVFNRSEDINGGVLFSSIKPMNPDDIYLDHAQCKSGWKPVYYQDQVGPKADDYVKPAFNPSRVGELTRSLELLQHQQCSVPNPYSERQCRLNRVRAVVYAEYKNMASLTRGDIPYPANADEIRVNKDSNLYYWDKSFQSALINQEIIKNILLEATAESKDKVTRFLDTFLPSDSLHTLESSRAYNAASATGFWSETMDSKGWLVTDHFGHVHPVTYAAKWPLITAFPLAHSEKSWSCTVGYRGGSAMIEGSGPIDNIVRLSSRGLDYNMAKVSCREDNLNGELVFEQLFSIINDRVTPLSSTPENQRYLKWKCPRRN